MIDSCVEFSPRVERLADAVAAHAAHTAADHVRAAFIAGIARYWRVEAGVLEGILSRTPLAAEKALACRNRALMAEWYGLTDDEWDLLTREWAAADPERRVA